MIEDPGEVERRRLLGIEDPDAPGREDPVETLEQVNEGKVPENRVALRMLAEEMINWPNLEVEAPKNKCTMSPCAKATDTGIDPKEAAKSLNIDWDSAAEIDETEVTPAVLVVKDVQVHHQMNFDILGWINHVPLSTKRANMLGSPNRLMMGEGNMNDGEDMNSIAVFFAFSYQVPASQRPCEQ